MSTKKKARRHIVKSHEGRQGTPPWVQKHEKDAEEEQLEDLVFGGAAFKQTLRNHTSGQEDLTGLEHIPDSQVRL